MTKFIGIEYGRGCLKTAIPDGPALAPAEVRKMFPDADWTMITPAPFDPKNAPKTDLAKILRFSKKYMPTHHPTDIS